MPIPRQDATLAQRLKAVEDEIARLRGVAGAADTDADDRIVDPAGNVVVEVDLDVGQGLKKPRLPFTITTPGNITVVTATSWVEAFTFAGYWQNAAAALRFNATTTAGTTAQVRAIIAGTATELHAPVTIADGDTASLAWSLDLPGGWDDYVVIEIQAQRVTGAGNVTVRPYSVAGG